MGEFIRVVHIIEVPEGDYCVDGSTICEYFDNPGGHGQCDLFIGFPKLEPSGDQWGYRYSKAPECRQLEKAERELWQDMQK